jgi:MarR family transcriptional regulator for hemolysin
MTGHAHSTIDDSRMRRLLGYVLTLAAIPPLKAFDRWISEPLQLRRVEFTILVLVHDNEDTTTKLLARSLRLSLPYLTVTLDRMQERGLLTRVRSEVDRRSQFIRLTDEGRALMLEADAVASTMEADLLEVFSAGERAMLFELLQKLIGHPRRSAEPGRTVAKERPVPAARR